jgi:uncharacterized membrane protein
MFFFLYHILLADITHQSYTHSPWKVLLFGEGLVSQFAIGIKIILEFLAIFIILIASFDALKKLLRFSSRISKAKIITNLRLELAHSLALSLEFLLAADVVGTAVSPNWDAVGKLAAIAVIRTFLNYFLEKEVEELEKINNTTYGNDS